MKKILMATLLVGTMIFAGCGEEKAPEPAKDSGKTKIGVITHLNASEIEYNELMKKLEASYRPSKANLSVEYKYYDKMNDMQMALEAGQVDLLSTYQNVANYMAQQNNSLEILKSEKVLEDSFCFAVRSGDTILKNELDKAIKSMIADGTLTALSKKYIVDLKADEEPPAVEMPKIEDADTIKAAVTGDLPPFDMVLSDGMPAGFSTAVLSEISKRIKKNIEIIDIDSAARAAILSSKGADVVFWVAVPKDSTLINRGVRPLALAMGI